MDHDRTELKLHMVPSDQHVFVDAIEMTMNHTAAENTYIHPTVENNVQHSQKDNSAQVRRTTSIENIMKSVGKKHNKGCPEKLGCIIFSFLTMTAMAAAICLFIMDLRDPTPRCQDSRQNCVHGNCTSNARWPYSCLCDSGWKGDNCNQALNCHESEYYSCDHGECTEHSDGSFNCSCEDGWMGHLCFDDADECRETNVDCGQGACVNSVGSFHCECNKGWYGEKCDDGPCDPDICLLPNCRCPGMDIPNGIPVEDTPIMVYLTFDDGVSYKDGPYGNFHFYQNLQDQGWKNPNGCPAKFTFFVSGDNWDPLAVGDIYRMGHEIASHSISHKFPTSWWLTASYEEYVGEIVGMKRYLVQKASVPSNDITGMRVPFLAAGSDNMFKMLQDNNFRYDSSLVVKQLSWPFTLDFDIPKWVCTADGTCPKKPYPGLWEMALNPMRSTADNSTMCGMTDESSCLTNNGTEGVIEYLRSNFQRHVNNNHIPFTISLHATWFDKQADGFEALKEFMRDMAFRDDVWLLSVSQILDWVQHPTPISKGVPKSWKC